MITPYQMDYRSTPKIISNRPSVYTSSHQSGTLRFWCEWAKFSGPAQFQYSQKFQVQVLAQNWKLRDLVTNITDPGHIDLVQCKRVGTRSFRFPRALFRLYRINYRSGPKISPVLVVCIWRHQKLDYANYDQFAPNCDMAYKTIQRVSVPNSKLFRRMNIELWTKEAGHFFISYMGKRAGRHSFAHQHGCRNINVWRFSKFWAAQLLHFLVYGPETWRDLAKQGYLPCVKSCQKHR